MTIERKDKTMNYHDGFVTGSWEDDQTKTYPAQIADRHWNGWAVPRFTREVAERIVRDQVEMVAEFPDSPTLTWDGDKIVFTTPAGVYEDHEVVDILSPDDGWYYIGAMDWCWQEVDRETGETLYLAKGSV